MPYVFSDYRSFDAYELFQWAQKENNRIKASKIQIAADRMEGKYRKYHATNGVPHPTYSPHGSTPAQF